MKMLVKVIKVSSEFCYDCGGSANIFPVSTDWEEVDEARYYEISHAVNLANVQKYQEDEKFVLLSYNNTMTDEVFALASDFAKAQKAKEEDRKQKAEKAAEDRKAKALERKRKQLEKLRKELEE